MNKADYIMSASELQGLKEEAKESSSMLKTMEDEGYGKGTRADEMLDKGAIRSNIKKYDMLLDKYRPRKITGKAKDKLASRAQELGAFIQDGMLTREETRDHGMAYKNLAWEQKKAAAIQEWKQCQRRLEPGDPSASNVERLRRVR